MKALIITILLLLIALKAGAEEIIKKGEVLTLDKCLEIASKKQPDIIAAANVVRVNQGRVGQANANYYPQMDITSGYSRTSPVSRLDHNSYDQYTGSITLKQSIYDFGKTSAQASIQNLNLGSSRSELDDVTAQIIFNVKQSYYGLLQAKKNRDVAAETVRQFQRHLEQAKGFYEVGIKPKFDVTKAEVDLSNSKLNLIKAENSVRLAVAALNNAVGVPDAPEYTVEDNLLFQRYGIVFSEAVEKAYSSRPDLASVVLRKEAAEKSVRLANAGHYPVLTGSAAYNRTGEKFPLGEGWNAGVHLSFPVFSGFLTQYQVEEARANVDVLKAKEESLRQSIFLEVQQAYLNLKEAEESIPSAELVVKQAEENLELASGRYETGVGNPIEVADAHLGLSNAKFSYIRVLYDYRVARAALEKAMGAK